MALTEDLLDFTVPAEWRHLVMPAAMPVNKQIVIVGAGKVGSDLAVLLALENAVAVVSRFSRPEAREALERLEVETIRSDLGPTNLASLPRETDLVFLEHAFHGRAAAEPEVAWQLNAMLTGRLMEWYADAEAVVAASTGNVYDGAPPVELTEADDEAPRGPYGLSRYAGEVLIHYFSQARGVPASIVRYTYGNGLNYGMLRRLVKLIADGEPVPLSLGNRVNLIAHGDLVRYTALAASVATTPPLVLNCTSPEPIPLSDLVATVCEVGGFSPPAWEPGERIDHLNFRCDRLVAELGPPQVTWRQMVEVAVDAHLRGVELVGQS